MYLPVRPSFGYLELRCLGPQLASALPSFEEDCRTYHEFRSSAHVRVRARPKCTHARTSQVSSWSVHAGRVGFFGLRVPFYHRLCLEPLTGPDVRVALDKAAKMRQLLMPREPFSLSLGP